jgi:magnesium-transporting ATPase (P-type)
LHSFHGTIAVQGCQEKIIDFDNFMLRETVLKNSQEVVGVVVYTGYDTKIIQNQGRVENKISHVEKNVNIIQGVLLIILILLSATCTIAFAYYHTINHPRANLVYLPPMVTETSL